MRGQVTEFFPGEIATSNGSREIDTNDAESNLWAVYHGKVATTTPVQN